MFSWALFFLFIAFFAGVIGFFGIAGVAGWIAKSLFFVSVSLFVVTLVLGGRERVEQK